MALDLSKYKLATTTETTPKTKVDLSKYKTTPVATTQPARTGGFFSKFNMGGTGLDRFAQGFAGQAVKGVQGLGQTVLRGAEMVTGKEKGAFGSQETFFGDKSSALDPQGLAGGAGAITEKVGEYVATGAALKPAFAAINTLSNGIKLGKLTNFAQATARAWGKAGLEGVKTYTQERLTGGTAEGSKETAITAGVFAGLTAGLLNTVGEVWRGFAQPTKVTEKILRDTQQSLDKGMSGRAIEDLQRTNPTEFRRLVQEGLVKLDDTGKPIVEKTLAEQALNRGIVSSPDAMANTVWQNKAATEVAKREALKGYTQPVSLGGKTKEYKNVLQTVIDKADDLGAEVDDVTEARRLLDALNKGYKGRGTMNASDMYDLRLYIDRMGGPRMFSNQNAKITSNLSANYLKQLRSGLKTELDKQPGFSKIMDDYKFYIEAWKALVKSGLSDQASKANSLTELAVDATRGFRLRTAQATAQQSVPSITGQTLRGVTGTTVGEQIFGGVKNYVENPSVPFFGE